MMRLRCLFITLIFCNILSNGMRREEGASDNDCPNERLRKVVAAIEAFQEAQKNDAPFSGLMTQDEFKAAAEKTKNCIPFVNKKFITNLGRITNTSSKEIYIYSSVKTLYGTIPPGETQNLNRSIRLSKSGLCWENSYAITITKDPRPEDTYLGLYISYLGIKKELTIRLKGWGQPINNFIKTEVARLPESDNYVDAFIDLSINCHHLDQSASKVIIVPVPPALQELLAKAKTHYEQTHTFLELPLELDLRSKHELIYESFDKQETMEKPCKTLK